MPHGGYRCVIRGCTRRVVRTESIANEVGGGELAYGHLARLGNELLVAWTRPGHLQVALTAP